MREFLDATKLRVLLQAAPWLIMRAAKRSPRIGALLRERDFVMQVATRRRPCGHFVLRDGRIAFRTGLHAAPDFAQTWTTAGEAVRTLASRDVTDLLRAFDDGGCDLKGDFLVVLWFNEAVKLARNPTLE